MSQVILKRRSCERFYVPGANLSYTIHRFLLPEKNNSGELCPLLTLAKGGASFLTDKRIGRGRKLSLLLNPSAEGEHIQLEGKVVYCLPAPITSHRFQVGVAFAPFSPEKGHNSRKALRALDRLEKTYGTAGQPG
jgi:Tfp pilus assembly protein PilZ